MFGMPFTFIRHDEHLPIPQKKPRGFSYFKLFERVVILFACKADPIVSVTYPNNFFLLK
jgi:hypothetical protein